MNLDEAITTLRDFIKAKFEIPATDSEFTEDVHLFDYGYVDSFGAVELTTFVEQTFGIKVNESDLLVHPMNTIREIATFAVQRRAGEV